MTVLEGTKLVTEGIAEGSAYLSLACDGCKSIIGKTYRSTVDATDVYRDTFSFDMDKIKSYVLGSCNLNRKEGITTTECIFLRSFSCRFKFHSSII